MEDMKALDPAAIASVRLIKDKEAIAKFLADEAYAHFVDSARNGVIVITLKQPGTYTPNRKKAKAIYVH